jgi:hypothetical protein
MGYSLEGERKEQSLRGCSPSLLLGNEIESMKMFSLHITGYVCKGTACFITIVLCCCDLFNNCCAYCFVHSIVVIIINYIIIISLRYEKKRNGFDK